MQLFLLLSLVANVYCLDNFTGYVVVAQWDGRTIPNVQWALDVTRQDTEFRDHQELKFINLIPTTVGDASHFTYTAYDAATRTYLTTVARNASAGSLWAMNITKDVENVTAIGQEVRYGFPQSGAPLVGLEIFNNKGALTPLALFKDGTVLQIDSTSGATKVFANLVNASHQYLTTAIELDPASLKLWAIGQETQGLPNRFMVTLDLNTKAVTSILLAPLQGHDPVLCTPFDMVWLPTLQVLLTFNTGDFDQLIYTSPASGEMAFGTNNMAEYDDGNGHYEFLADDFLEADDLWANSCVDNVKGLVYFQCSSVDDTGGGLTSLCATPILPSIKEIPWINTHIQPMTYGYAGMEYVQVIS